jgi:hypothetical protein
MPRTPEEIWPELNQSISATSVLQAEFNEAIAGPIKPPVEPPIEPPVEPPVTGGLPLYPEPKLPPGDYPKDPPNNGQTRRVPEDFGSIMAALDAAQPGDTVSCDNGYSADSMTFGKAFPRNNPVVVRARNTLKANLTGRLTITAPGYWVSGFKQTYRVNQKGNGAIVVGADDINITKMEIQSPHGITSAGSTKRKNINIGWCLFNGDNPSTSGISNIYFDLPNGGSAPSYDDMPNSIHIYNCDFDDDKARPSGAMEDHVIYFGPSKPKGNDKLTMRDVIIYQCLIRANNQRVRGFYMKRGCIIMQSSILGCKYNWGIRHGGDSLIISNDSAGSKTKLVLNGRGNKLYNNVWSKAELYAGSSKDGKGGDPLYQAADYADLDANAGPLTVGYITSKLDTSQGGKVNNVTIHRHTGNITKSDAGYDAATYKKDEKAEYSYPPRIKLTPEMVGPLA